MKYTLDWLTNPEVFAVNRIAAHSDHRIYANHLEADADNSSLIQNLNGTWKFAWAKNPSEWQQKFYEESDSTDNFDNIQVPGHPRAAAPVLPPWRRLLCSSSQCSSRLSHSSSRPTPALQL